MLTGMTDDDWTLALEVFHACQSRRGDKGRDDRLFLEAMHFFTVENVSWRAGCPNGSESGTASGSASRG